MKGTTLDYNIQQPRTPNVYYQIWDTYRTHEMPEIPSYAFLQARKQVKNGYYPMDWNFHQAKKLITDIQRKDNFRKAKAVRDRAESAVVRQYSRDRFEHALNARNTDLDYSFQKGNRLLAVRERPKTTGPTRHGSPIYNKRTELLSSLRVRTAIQQEVQKETTPKGAKKMIEETIESYNQQYQLIPNHLDRHLSIDNAKFISVDEAKFEKPATSSNAADKLNNVKSVAAVAAEYRILKSASLPVKPKETNSLPILTVNVEDLGGAEVEGQTDRKPQSSSLLQVWGSSSRPVSAHSSAPSERSNIVPRVKTWVDDVSVSSDGQASIAGSATAAEEPEELQTAEQQPVLPEPKPLEHLELKAKEDSEREECQPPDLICPSSEERSRSYAVLQWLMKCDFPKAIRTTPLI